MPRRKKTESSSPEWLLFVGGVFLFLVFSFIIMNGLRLAMMAISPPSPPRSSPSYHKPSLPKDPLITPAPRLKNNL